MIPFKNIIIKSSIRKCAKDNHDTSGRSTQQIYNYAEDGGLLGHGGFWSKTMAVIPGYIHKSFGSRFD